MTCGGGGLCYFVCVLPKKPILHSLHIMLCFKLWLINYIHVCSTTILIFNFKINLHAFVKDFYYKFVYTILPKPLSMSYLFATDENSDAASQIYIYFSIHQMLNVSQVTRFYRIRCVCTIYRRTGNMM